MSQAPSVFVVILNWQGRSCLPKTLVSVFRMKYPNFEVVVVDNASTDGSLEEAIRRFGKAHFIRNESNVGFAAGMNVGIRYALNQGARYVWLLNYDAVADERALEALMREAEGRRYALLSPLIVNGDGSVWFAAGTIRWWRMRAVHETAVKSSERAYGSDFLTGCALFFSRETIRKTGLLDEGYFLYYEDADLSVRAKRLGIPLLVVPTARVVHEERSRSNPEKDFYLVLSGLRFFFRRSPMLLRPWMVCFTMARRIKNAIDVRRGIPGSDPVRRAYIAYAQSKRLL